MVVMLGSTGIWRKFLHQEMEVEILYFLPQCWEKCSGRKLILWMRWGYVIKPVFLKCICYTLLFMRMILSSQYSLRRRKILVLKRWLFQESTWRSTTRSPGIIQIFEGKDWIYTSSQHGDRKSYILWPNTVIIFQKIIFRMDIEKKGGNLREEEYEIVVVMQWENSIWTQWER